MVGWCLEITRYSTFTSTLSTSFHICHQYSFILLLLLGRQGVVYCAVISPHPVCVHHRYSHRSMKVHWSQCAPENSPDMQGLVAHAVICGEYVQRQSRQEQSPAAMRDRMQLLQTPASSIYRVARSLTPSPASSVYSGVAGSLTPRLSSWVYDLVARSLKPSPQLPPSPVYSLVAKSLSPLW